VILFGRRVEGGTDIYFNVLGADVQNDAPTLRWSGFTRLEFTRQGREVGMSIVTLVRDAATMVASEAPFHVVTDQNYVAIVQQSARGTLYVSRFRLLKTQTGTDQKTTVYSLAPAWEVRYARSGKEDVPADPSDTQEYLDPDGVAFLEPALELSMVDAVKDGAFEVLLLPISGTARFAWQFLVPGTASDIAFFNFPATSSGLFDVTGKKLGKDYRIRPDSRCTIVPASGGMRWRSRGRRVLSFTSSTRRWSSPTAPASESSAPRG
jgi:large repetitive protein